MQRIHTFPSKLTIQSLGSSSRRNKCWTSQVFSTHGLEFEILSPNNPQRTSWVLIYRGKSRFVDGAHIPNAELRSSAECLTEFQKADRRRLASRRLVRPMFQVRLASRRLVRTPSAILPAKRPFHAKNHSHDQEELELFLPMLRLEELCQQRSPKW